MKPSPLLFSDTRVHHQNYYDSNSSNTTHTSRSSMTSSSSSSSFSTVTLSEVHTVDFEFSPSPQHAHFVSVDGGLFLQHENPISTTAMIHPSFSFDVDAHPNTAMLHVPSYSSVIIIWRNRSLMDHPMHLHGYKMEILDVDVPHREEHCTLSKCKLNVAFDSSSQRLAHLNESPIGSAVLKDTFILPAGGAVATRIQTGAPALWFAHCHLDPHKEDGMAFVLNVGNYHHSQSSTTMQLPADYPSCDTPFLKSKRENPACQCYINKDAVLDGSLTKRHHCSRDHLCIHEKSQAANLDTYKPAGFRISSKHLIPNWTVSLIFVSIISIVTFLIINKKKSFAMLLQETPSKSQDDDDNNNNVDDDFLFPSKSPYTTTTTQASAAASWLIRLRRRVATEWKTYRPGCTNTLRVFEVTGLALLTGYLFYDVGNDPTSTGLSEKYSLLFFSITLWTFTRMYPAVGSFNAWHSAMKSSEDITSISDIAIWCASRCIVSTGNEGKTSCLECHPCMSNEHSSLTQAISSLLSSSS